MEEMADRGIPIPGHAGNSCVVDCLGSGPNGTHDGFGGIDTALAMLAAMERSPVTADTIKAETYISVISALNRDGDYDEAILLLRTMVVDRFLTPSLSIFAEVAQSAVKDKKAEQVLQVMTLAKASGYVLDSVASSETGRSLLASGVIAAEQLNNVALGLRLLTAASKAEGCSPDAGDALVAASSSSAQRACMLIHRRAIDEAVTEGNWKLAVKILELMPTRSLIPSANVMRKVVNICAKSGKSRKATALLLDWVGLFF
jgi:pentatricopeptide repeat protein